MGNSFNTGDTPVYEKTANKDAASGYAGLDANSQVKENPKVHLLTGDSTVHTNSRLITGAIAETFPRSASKTNASVLTSSRESLAMIELPSGKVVSSITFWTGTTLWTPGTHQWGTLRDSTGAKLAITADDGVTAWAANTAKTFFLSRGVTDAVATSGSAVITSATAAFTASDVGKNITFMGAGAAGVPLGTSAARVTILSVDSATQITVSANAGTSVASAGTLYIATPYTTVASGAFYIGQFLDGTVPSHLTQADGTTVIMGTAPALCAKDTSNTSMTTPLTAVQNTGASLTGGNASLPYAYVS